MATCDLCGREENMPYQCNRCGSTFCGEHRLPESHDCPGLNDWTPAAGDGHFDSGFGETVGDSRTGRGSQGVLDRLPVDTGPGGIGGYFRNNMTFVFLIVIWVIFGLQWIALLLGGASLHNSLFVLESVALWQVWTWVTSVFAHNPGGLLHIAFNSIVLYFFGPLVERKIGSAKFAALFVGSGVIAGLSQVIVGMFTSPLPVSVLGASGAILAIMGVLTVLNPDLRVLLFFVIPMPLWLLTAGFALFSVFVMVGGGAGAGGVAHLAHLVGLVIGLVYGQRLKRAGVRAPNQLRLGGGPGGPGGGMGGPGRGRF